LKTVIRVTLPTEAVLFDSTSMKKTT